MNTSIASIVKDTIQNNIVEITFSYDNKTAIRATCKDLCGKITPDLILEGICPDFKSFTTSDEALLEDAKILKEIISTKIKTGVSFYDIGNGMDSDLISDLPWIPLKDAIVDSCYESIMANIDLEFTSFLEKEVSMLIKASIEPPVEIKEEVDMYVANPIKNVSETIVEPSVVYSKTEKEEMKFDKTFTDMNSEEFKKLGALVKRSVNKASITLKESKNPLLYYIQMKKDPSIGVYNNVSFYIPKLDMNKDTFNKFNKAIRVAGVDTKGMNNAQLFSLKVLMAISTLDIGYAKIKEGIDKGLIIVLSVEEFTSLKGKKYIKCYVPGSIKSVGPLNEGQTGRFFNPNILANSEFGENVSTTERLVFEAANKVTAREVKLGAYKTSDVYSIGKRNVFLFDTVLNQDVDKDILNNIERMLVLGTIWVSKQEFVKLGFCRTIPLKGVTAPLPEYVGELNDKEVLVGGNSHKSKLNGLAVKALGLKHSEVSKFDETTIRSMLNGNIQTINLFGVDIKVYTFVEEIFVTNFYSLYGLEGVEVDGDDTVEVVGNGFYNDAISKVVETGGDFNLNRHIDDSVIGGVVKRKPRVVDITSAELQQVGVSYGQEAAQGFIDELFQTNAYLAKGFAVEGLDGLKMIPRNVIENYGKEFLKGEIETTVFSKFALEKAIEIFGSNDFYIPVGEYNFVFNGFGTLDNYKFDGDFVEVNSAISMLLNFIITLRNPKTNWAKKYVNHTLELNSIKMKKIQVLKSRGAYLPAVTGFWLKSTECFTFAQKEGKVTSAKLPILFDQSITSLNNNLDTVYSDEEMELYADLFKGGCFVSPEYFLAQENDGDGDLVKITVPSKYIPVWRDQPNFTANIRKEYQDGEWSGLKLSLKPYKVMLMTDFHNGNIQAKTAKDNVAVMASNEYKVKELMIPYMKGITRKADLATMICEASAYLVQYEAMRAAKHDGGVNNYPFVKCNPIKKDVPFNVYVESWIKLLNEYFGYDIDYLYDYWTLQGLLFDLYFCKYSNTMEVKIDNNDSLNAFGSELDYQTLSYCVMQNGYARSVGNLAKGIIHEMFGPVSILMNTKLGHKSNIVYTGFLKSRFNCLTKFDVHTPFQYFVYKMINGGNVNFSTLDSDVTALNYWDIAKRDLHLINSKDEKYIVALGKFKRLVYNSYLKGFTFFYIEGMKIRFNNFVESNFSSNSEKIVEKIVIPENCVKSSPISDLDLLDSNSFIRTEKYGPKAITVEKDMNYYITTYGSGVNSLTDFKTMSDALGFIKLNNLKGSNGRSLKVKINKGVYNIN